MNRKSWMLLLVYLLLMTTCAKAQTYYVNGEFEYTITTDGTAAITGYFGNATDLVIPQTLDGYTVTTIGEDAFFSNSSLMTVSIPDSVTAIESTAFRTCSSLRAITIPNSVISMGSHVFQNCYLLESVSLPSGLTQINTCTFQNCYALKGIEIPNGVTAIGNYAFESCTSLETIVIPKSVVGLTPAQPEIGRKAFKDCDSLTSVIFEGDAPYINSANTIWPSFDVDTVTLYYNPNTSGWTTPTWNGYKCYPLEIATPAPTATVTPTPIPTPTVLPEQIVNGDFIYKPITDSTATIIGYTGNATHLDIPTKLDGYTITAIGDNVFENEYQLESVNISEGITLIGNSTFFFCNHLKSISLPSTLTSLGREAFAHCASLESIVLPKEIKTINYGAFDGCYQLQSVTFPENLDTIESIAFRNCQALSFNEFPSILELIGDSAFEHCQSLTTITMPEKIMYLGSSAFRNCDNLSSVYFLGNAPTVEAATKTWPTFVADRVTLYYQSEKSGWKSPRWNGYWCFPEDDATCQLKDLTEVDYLALSSIAYMDAPKSGTPLYAMLGNNWDSAWNKTEISNSELYEHLWNWQVLDYEENTDNGFYATAFVNDYDEVVITYRGSIPIDFAEMEKWTDEEWNDFWCDWWDNDAFGVVGNTTTDKSQVSDAFAFYRDVQSGRSSSQIAVTGHSLGGGLADIVSARFGCFGCTINAISILDVAYNQRPADMASSFRGVDDWNFYDIVNASDYLAGAYEVEHKPAKIIPQGRYNAWNPSTHLGFKHHMISSVVYKAIDGKVKMLDYKDDDVRVGYGNWPIAGLMNDRTMQMGSRYKDDQFNYKQAFDAWVPEYAKDVLKKFWNALHWAEVANEMVFNSMLMKITSYGGDGNDDLLTYINPDILVGGRGNDILNGNWGDDVYFYTKGDGVDTIYDLGGKDSIYLLGFDSSDTISVQEPDGNSRFTRIFYNGNEIIKIYNNRAEHAGNQFTLYNGVNDQYDITDQIHFSHTARLMGRYEINCPVDIDIVDANGTVVYTVKDSNPGSFYTEYGHFYVLDNPDSPYNHKALDLFEGYSIRIRGFANGEMSFMVQDTDGYLLYNPYAANNISVTPSMIATVEKEAQTGDRYLAIDTNGDGMIDQRIPLTPVHTSVDDHDKPLQKVVAVAPTCNTPGSMEYYVCSCGKLFSDPKGKNEITDLNSLILPATSNHQYANGLCTVCGHKEPTIPKTGDSTPLAALAALLVFSGTFLLINLKRKHI